MIRIFYIEDEQVRWEKNPEDIALFRDKRLVWVDLQSPSEAEKKGVEQIFEVEFQTQQEAAEIESSSRYYEDREIIEANNLFVVQENKAYVSKQVSFLLKNKVLFTLRGADLKSFAESVRKLKTIGEFTIKNGLQMWILLLETRIDFDADFIESLNRQTNVISRVLLKEKDYDEEMLIKITELQEYTILIRESIIDKQRLVNSLQRSHFVASESDKERLRINLKDLGSLLQHTQFSFERLEYLQNTFLGLVNIEQNQVIKIFTVMTVVFLPPTLVASLYGMNFAVMPELNWRYGYLFALGLMVASSLAFLLYFKWKKWL